MSGAENKAVFLSYASQDAAAAQRLCEALRATGVEVWFDQNELAGGDAWDAKIRGQIKACALFVPVISAATQARREGYFRLEWKLAAQRTHTMADGTPFLLPVVIDGTGDAEALVPEEFRAVQWTRLDLKDTPESLAVRVTKLLGGAPGGDGGRSGPPTEGAPRRKKIIDPWIARAAAILGLLLGLVYGTRPLWKTVSPREARATSTPANASKAQAAIVQARALFELWDIATAEELKLADRLLKEATELEPTAAEGWAELAVLSYAQIRFGFDASDARRELQRTAAERAMKLAPDSDAAKLALAMRYRLDSATSDDALSLLRGLAERRPTDKFVLRQLGNELVRKERFDEALAAYERAAALPGGDANAHFSRAEALRLMGRFAEALAAYDQALALRPDFVSAHVKKAVLLVFSFGDMERGKAALRQIPATLASDERVATVAAYLWYYGRDAEQAAEALRRLSKDYVESSFLTIPKGLIAGLVHRLAGRPAAATAEWRVALSVVEQRLKTSPTATGELFYKAWLLALLDERAAAEEALTLYEQLMRLPAGKPTGNSWMLYAALGREAEVTASFAERLKSPTPRVARDAAADYRFDPMLDRFRASPTFKELAQVADGIFAATPGK